MAGQYRRTRIKLGSLVSSILTAGFCLVSPLAAQAQTPALLAADTVPTFLGVNLPLRPHEHLAPIGTSGCSFVLFATTPADLEARKQIWEKWEWLGECRFGLAHGKGVLQLKDSASVSDATAVYGTPLNPPLVRNNLGRLDHFYSGTAFSDFSAKHVATLAWDEHRGTTDAQLASTNQQIKPLTLGVLEEVWLWSYFIYFDSYDAAGNSKQVSIRAEDIGAWCTGALPPAFQPFVGEIRKTCGRKKADKHIMVRREGPIPLSSYNNPVVWMKTCPLLKNSNETECDRVLNEALGKTRGEIESVMAASPAASAAAIQEILARYAPLEEAVTQRMKALAASMPSQEAAQ
jgi:hypothetical protein